MKTIEFTKFRAECSAILSKAQKDGEKIRVVRNGVTLVEVIPVRQPRKRARRKTSRNR